MPLDAIPSYRHTASVGKRKTTVYIEEDLLRQARVYAARAGKRDSEVVEEALRSFLGFDVLERVWARSDLSEEESLQIAYEALHETRKAEASRRTRAVG